MFRSLLIGVVTFVAIFGISSLANKENKEENWRDGIIYGIGAFCFVFIMRFISTRIGVPFWRSVVETAAIVVVIIAVWAYALHELPEKERRHDVRKDEDGEAWWKSVRPREHTEEDDDENKKEKLWWENSKLPWKDVEVDDDDDGDDNDDNGDDGRDN